MKVLAIDFKWFPHTVFPCDGYTKALIKYLIKNIFQCGRFGGIDCWWIWGNKTRNIWRRTWRRPKQDKKVENCRRKFRRRRPCQRGWQNRSKVTPFNIIFDIILIHFNINQDRTHAPFNLHYTLVWILKQTSIV